MQKGIIIDNNDFSGSKKGVVINGPVQSPISLSRNRFSDNEICIELTDGNNVTISDNEFINAKIQAISITTLQSKIDEIEAKVSSSQTFTPKERSIITDALLKFREHRNLTYTLKHIAVEIGKHATIGEFIEIVKHAFSNFSSIGP